MDVKPGFAAPRRGFAASGIVALALVVATLSSNVPSPLYGLYQQRWGFSSAALTGVFAAYAAGVLIAMLVTGPLSDRIGRRAVMVPSLLIVAAGAAAFCMANNLAWLVVARVLAGAGTGALVGAANAALVEVDPARSRERAATIGTLAFTVGAALGPGLSSLALWWNLWPTVLPFVMVTALSLFSIAALYLIAWPAGEAAGPAFRLSEWRPQRPGVPRPILAPFLTAAGALALSWSVGSLFGALGPTFATHLLGIRDRALAGCVVVGFQLCGGVAQFLSRSRSTRRTLLVGPLVMTAGMLLCVAGFVTVSAPLFVVGTAGAAVGFGATFVGSASAVNQLAPPDRRAEVVSAFYVVGYGSMSLPVLAVGAASDALGLGTTMLAFAALIAAGATVVIVCSRAVFPRRGVLGWTRRG
jgi:MFS family permease